MHEKLNTAIPDVYVEGDWSRFPLSLPELPLRKKTHLLPFVDIKTAGYYKVIAAVRGVISLRLQMHSYKIPIVVLIQTQVFAINFHI